MNRQPDIFEKSKKTSVNFGCCSWPAVVLTVAIIAIRAFQPGAEAMSQWSFGSWILMLLPLFLPFAVWIVLLFLTAFGAIAFGGCK